MEWGVPDGKSYSVPAWEIPAFELLLNRVDHSVVDAQVYASPISNFKENLHHKWVVDNDAFATNQFLHPYRGAVNIEIPRAPRALTECNCSICRRYGVRWAYYSRKTVRIRAPRGSLQSYARGKHLYFDHCRQCGCLVLYKPIVSREDVDRLGINMRLIDDPEVLKGVRVLRFDGAQSWTDVESYKLTKPSW